MGARRATRDTREGRGTATIEKVPKSRAAPKRAGATKAGAAKTPKKTAAKARSEKAGSRRATAGARAARPTLASIAAQITALSEQVASILALLGSERSAPASAAPASVASAAPANGVAGGEVQPSETRAECAPATFETDLATWVQKLDRSGRHGGLVPIPELRDAFLKRGWTRRSFDERLLQAERDFVVDLKAANDPARLAAPDLAIVDTGRGHLQYVVLR